MGKENNIWEPLGDKIVIARVVAGTVYHALAKDCVALEISLEQAEEATQGLIEAAYEVHLKLGETYAKLKSEKEALQISMMESQGREDYQKVYFTGLLSEAVDAEDRTNSQLEAVEIKTRKYQKLTAFSLAVATVLGIFLAGNIYDKKEELTYQPVPLAVTNSPLSGLTTLEMHTIPNSPWCEPETRVEFTQYLRGLCPELPEGRTPRYLQFNGGEVLIRADNCESAAATIDRIVFPECDNNDESN